MVQKLFLTTISVQDHIILGTGTCSGGNLISGSFAEARAAVWRADSEEWSKGESKVAELRNYKWL